MKCPKCRADNPDTSKFCGSCAAVLAAEVSPSLTKTIQAPAGPAAAGSVIAGKYRILEEVGRGGMGVVYKAEDIKLQRPVALKFLPHQWVSDPDARERFIQEARAASALDHPNVCNIYEIGEVEDGRMYIAMAFYEGESLREKIRQGPLAPAEALGIALQVAAGMAKAHEKGIVHRDIKPANVLITKEGVAKVVDFGLAKLAGQAKLTREGTTVGTVAYMSPEQAKGEPVDQRTDVWSLGVVLYEMLSGALPFKGDYEQTLIHSILQQEPERLTKLRKDLPLGLENIVFKALTKRPAGRYQTMKDMFGDLRAIADGMKPAGRASLLFRGRILGVKKVHAYPAFTGLVILAALAAFLVLPKRGQAYDSIAVLPIENVTGDPAQEPFLYGVHQDLISQLQKVRALTVIDKNTMLTFKGTKKRSSEIAKDLKVSALVSASAVRTGNSVLIRFEVIDAPNNRQIGDGRFEGEYRDILSLEGQAAAAIARKIQIDLTSEEMKGLTRERPVDPDAYEAYQKGMFIIGRLDLAVDLRADISQSIKYFEQALDHDAGLALAYSGLAWAYDASAVGVFPPQEAWPKAREAAAKALSLDGSLADAYAILGEVAMMFDWDWKAAEMNFLRSLELNPGNSWAHRGYAALLGCLGRHREAIAHAERSLELDPNTLNAYSGASQAYHSARRFDKVIAISKDALKLFPGDLYTQVGVAWGYYFQGDIAEATREIKSLIDSGKLADSPIMPGLLAMMGEREKAEHSLADLLKTGDGGYADPQMPAAVYALLGERDPAFEWLEKSVAQKSIGIPFLKVNAFWDKLRPDPRWPALLKRVGLE